MPKDQMLSKYILLCHTSSPKVKGSLNPKDNTFIEKRIRMKLKPVNVWLFSYINALNHHNFLCFHCVLSLLLLEHPYLFVCVCVFVFQDSLRQKEERIEELEEALRESVQITAEREVVLAQEEQARVKSQKQVHALSL